MWLESRESRVCMTVSTEIATPAKSTNSRKSDLLVSRGTDPNWDFGLIWIDTEEFEFLDCVDFRGVAFSVESVIEMPVSHVTRETVHFRSRLRRWVLQGSQDP